MSIEQNKTNGFIREYNKEKREESREKKKKRERKDREKREREKREREREKRERERERKGKRERERETGNRMNGVRRVVKSKKIRVGLTRFFENLIQK